MLITSTNLAQLRSDQCLNLLGHQRRVAKQNYTLDIVLCLASGSSPKCADLGASHWRGGSLQGARLEGLVVLLEKRAPDPWSLRLGHA